MFEGPDARCANTHSTYKIQVVRTLRAQTVTYEYAYPTTKITYYYIVDYSLTKLIN